MTSPNNWPLRLRYLTNHPFDPNHGRTKKPLELATPPTDRLRQTAERKVKKSGEIMSEKELRELLRTIDKNKTVRKRGRPRKDGKPTNAGSKPKSAADKSREQPVSSFKKYPQITEKSQKSAPQSRTETGSDSDDSDTRYFLGDNYEMFMAEELEDEKMQPPPTASSKPLTVLCNAHFNLDKNKFPISPRSIQSIRPSMVKPVPRIPISPYAGSPSSRTSELLTSMNSTPTTHLRRPTRAAVASLPAVASFSFNEVSETGRVDMPEISFSVGRAPSPASSDRRLSIRQTECAFRYKEIIVKKSNNFTQVIFSSKGRMKNSLNVQALQELTAVLNNAKYDDSSRLVLLTGTDTTFCSGVDLSYLTSGNIHLAARNMADTLRTLVNTMISFPKPLIAAVNGQAIGCGVAILPLCDIVYASDKATFYTPYTQLGQPPEAALTCTLAPVIGVALANEMLMAGRMLTALEAYQMGLVAQVFWPTSMMSAVIPRITNMANCSSRVLNSTKSLIRSQQKERLIAANHTEANILAEIWSTPECQKSMQTFLEHFDEK